MLMGMGWGGVGWANNVGVWWRSCWIGMGWGGVGGATTLMCGGVAAVKECVGVRRARVYGMTERFFGSSKRSQRLCILMVASEPGGEDPNTHLRRREEGHQRVWWNLLRAGEGEEDRLRSQTGPRAYPQRRPEKSQLPPAPRRRAWLRQRWKLAQLHPAWRPAEARGQNVSKPQRTA